LSWLSLNGFFLIIFSRFKELLILLLLVSISDGLKLDLACEINPVFTALNPWCFRHGCVYLL
jgi:hypothetical protein